MKKTISNPNTCARCKQLTPKPIYPVTRHFGQYFKKDESVLCWDCMRADSNYVRDFGAVTGDADR